MVGFCIYEGKNSKFLDASRVHYRGRVAILSMLLGAVAVLNRKLWAMMQAGKTHDALFFDPNRLFILKLNG